MGDFNARKRSLDVCEEEGSGNPKQDFDLSECDTQTDDSKQPDCPVSGGITPESVDSDSRLDTTELHPPQCKASDTRDLTSESPVVIENTEPAAPEDSIVSGQYDPGVLPGPVHNNQEAVLNTQEDAERSTVQQSNKPRSLSQEKAITEEQTEQLLTGESVTTITENSQAFRASPPSETKDLNNARLATVSEETSESNKASIAKLNQSTEEEESESRATPFASKSTSNEDVLPDEVESGDPDANRQSEESLTVSTATAGDLLEKLPTTRSPGVILRDKPGLGSPSSKRQSLPPNFFSELGSPVPPPRKNSPRKKSFKSSAAPPPPASAPSSPSIQQAPVPPGSESKDSRTGSIVSSSRSERSSSDSSNLICPALTHHQHLSSHSSTSPSTSERSTPATSPSSERNSRGTSPKRRAPRAPLQSPNRSYTSSPNSRVSLHSLSQSPPKSRAPAPPDVSRLCSNTSPNISIGSPASSGERDQLADRRSYSTPGSIQNAPVPPPRLKRRSHQVKPSDTRLCNSAIEDHILLVDRAELKRKHQSLPIESFDLDEEIKARHASGSAPSEANELSVDLTNTQNYQEPYEDMEARQRRLELENMRAHLFGYEEAQTGDFGETKHSPEAKSTAQFVDKGRGGMSGSPESLDSSQVIQDGSPPSQVLLSLGAGDQAHIFTNVPVRSSTDSAFSSSKHNSTPEKSKITLNFTDEVDDSNGYLYESRSPLQVDRGADPSKRLDQLIGVQADNHQPYKTVLNLSDSDIKTDDNIHMYGKVSPDQKSRIVLSLDSPKHTPESSRRNTVPEGSSSTVVYVQEDTSLRTHPQVGDDGYKTDIYVGSSSTYESKSNYEESENSMAQDLLDLSRSEAIQSEEDSDMSDNEANFHATFEPHVHTDEAETDKTVASRVDPDEEFSGVTLVSYTSPGETPETFSRASPPSEVKERVTSGVVLNLSPPSYPQPVPVESPGEQGTPGPVKLTRITRLESPPAETYDKRLKLEIKTPPVSLIESPPPLSTSTPLHPLSPPHPLLPPPPLSPAPPLSPPPPLSFASPLGPLSPLSPPGELDLRLALDGRDILDQSPSSDKVENRSSGAPRAVAYNNDNTSDNPATVVRTGTTVYHSAGPGIGSRARPSGNNKPVIPGPASSAGNSGSHADNVDDFTANPSPNRVTVNLAGQLDWHSGATTTSTTSTNSTSTTESSTGSQPDLVTISSSADPTMDPITGLRKTGSVTPVDKAIRFVATTEPTFRMTKKLDPDIGKELESERETLMDSMRVRRKKLDTWVPGVELEDTNPQYKTESEIRYEQRKNRGDRNEDIRWEKPPDVIPTQDVMATLAIYAQGKKPGKWEQREELGPGCGQPTVGMALC